VYTRKKVFFANFKPKGLVFEYFKSARPTVSRTLYPKIKSTWGFYHGILRLFGAVEK
jgi:hypothetical protein